VQKKNTSGKVNLFNVAMEANQTLSTITVLLGRLIIMQTSDKEKYSSLIQISLGASVIENINNSD
jgi:hypothetical protein